MLDYRLRPMKDKTWLREGGRAAPKFSMSWEDMQSFQAIQTLITAEVLPDGS